MLVPDGTATVVGERAAVLSYTSYLWPQAADPARIAERLVRPSEASRHRLQSRFGCFPS